MGPRATIALILTFLALPAGAAELTAAEVFRVASPSVVVVHGVDQAGARVAQGSGVVIAPEVVVTNCHVFSAAFSAVVVRGTHRFPATLRHADVDRDLCSFAAPGLAAPAAAIGSTQELEVGSPVYAIGAPQGLSLTLSDGLLSGLRGIGDGDLLQITAPISPGSSGGGLFDARGRLIGITTMYLDKSQQLNFAVPVEWIHQLPSRHRVNEPGSGLAAPRDSEIDAARTALNELGYELEAADPERYARRMPELVRDVKRIRDAYPPARWASEARRSYEAIVQREHAAAGVSSPAADRVTLFAKVTDYCIGRVLKTPEVASLLPAATTATLDDICKCATTSAISQATDEELVPANAEAIDKALWPAFLSCAARSP